MKGFSILVIVLSCLINIDVAGQVNRYMVFFNDKAGSAYSTESPESFLSARSIARRTRQNIPTTAEDLPVNDAYVSEVRTAGAKTFFTTKWMNGVLAEIHDDTVLTVANLPFVTAVILVAPGSKLSGGRIKKLKNKFSAAGTRTILPQLQQLGIDAMHSDGFHGENMAIAVLDAGFSGVNVATPFESLVSRNGIKQTFSFVLNSHDVFKSCSGCEHGTEVLSTIAANAADYTGAAYGADFYLYGTEDNTSEMRVEEYNWLFAAERADSAGVDIITTSLGYTEFDLPSMNYTYAQLNGITTVIARAANAAAARGIVVVSSAGNEGNNSWHYISTPADAQGVLAVGAINSSGVIAPFSSVGPSADHRIKPDVVALGVGTSVVLPTGSVGSNNGTSFSAPLVAGLAAGVWQAFPFLTAGQVLNTIIHSGDRAATPDNVYGYGLPNYGRVRTFIDETNDITLFPNPLDGRGPTDVRIKFTYNVGPVSILVNDALGRIVQQGEISVVAGSNPYAWSVESLPTGIYLFRVRTSFTSRTFRFVKS